LDGHHCPFHTVPILHSHDTRDRSGLGVGAAGARVGHCATSGAE
jgi:hypothetical protein